MAENNNKTVHISFTPEDYKLLKIEAEKLGMPISVLVKMCILKSLKHD